MESSSLIIFGFTGDLSKRKLLPALYGLELSGKLPADFQIIGVTRRELDMDELKNQLKSSIVENGDCNSSILDKLCARISLVMADISQPDDYLSLSSQLKEVLPNSCLLKLFYFAIPPDLFESVVQNLVDNKIHELRPGSKSRLLIEKPFGHSLESAEQLLDTIEPHFGEESIYRIDHYLAKDMAQNILTFRFSNPLVRSLWDSAHVKCVQISALEFIDIQGRVNFYEQTGTLRDMLQGHLIQLLALATMDEPASMNSGDIRRQRQLVMQAIKPIKDIAASTARGQYVEYKDEVNNQDSRTETFAALRLEIDNSRWRGVPIYLRAGKALELKTTEINIVFETDSKHHEQNILTFRLQPNEGIAISLAIKKPGLETETKMITMDYCYHDEADELSDAYERILYDGLRGDQTLFPTDSEILSSWKLLQPVLEYWASTDEGIEQYEQGATHLDVSDKLLEAEGDAWVRHESWVCTPRKH